MALAWFATYGVHARCSGEPISVANAKNDEAEALLLVILAAATAHTGRGAGKSSATEVVYRHADTPRQRPAELPQHAVVCRCRRDAACGNPRGYAKGVGMGVAKGRRAVRTAWSHVLFPVESAESGKPFDLDHLAITARERCSVPAAVYDKASAKGDGIVREALGGETLATRLTELWPADRPHLPVAEIADWFATFVYLQKLRDRVVLETAIRGALAKLDAKFAYAEGFDEPSGNYAWLLWQKAPIGPMPPTALLVRPEVAMAQLRTVVSAPPPPHSRWLRTLSPGEPCRSQPIRRTAAVSGSRSAPGRSAEWGRGIAAREGRQGEADAGGPGRRRGRIL